MKCCWKLWANKTTADKFSSPLTCTSKSPQPRHESMPRPISCQVYVMIASCQAYFTETA